MQKFTHPRTVTAFGLGADIRGDAAGIVVIPSVDNVGNNAEIVVSE